MHKIKYEDGFEESICDNLQEILESPSSNLNDITEFNDYLYIGRKPLNQYDNRMYRVDKNTNEAVIISGIDYMLDIESKATPVDPNKLKELLKWGSFKF